MMCPRCHSPEVMSVGVEKRDGMHFDVICNSCGFISQNYPTRRAAKFAFMHGQGAMPEGVVS